MVTLVVMVGVGYKVIYCTGYSGTIIGFGEALETYNHSGKAIRLCY